MIISENFKFKKIMARFIPHNELWLKSKPRTKRWIGRDHKGEPMVRLVLGQNTYIKKNHINVKYLKKPRFRATRPSKKTLEKRPEYKRHWIYFKEMYFNRVMKILDYFEYEREFWRFGMYREWYYHTFINELMHGMLHWIFWLPFIIVYFILKKILKLSRKYKVRSMCVYIYCCLLFYVSFDIKEYQLIEKWNTMDFL
jgi:hypothetical protein